MPPNPFVGLIYHWTGGLSAASCYLPFRGIRRWSWEVYWFLQGCFAWIIAPAVLAIALVPHVGYILRNAPHTTLLYAFFWGAMWCIGGLLFGLGVRYLGIVLGYTVALGFSTAFGTLVPPLFSGQFRVIASERSGEVTLSGVAVSLFAIALSGVAGRRKEVELAGREAHDAASPGGHGEFRFGLGLLVAALAGTFSACFAYGLAAAKPINDSARSILLAHGRSELWQSLPSLIIVLWGGWLTNFLWCGGLFLRNRSIDQFTHVPGYRGPRQITLNYLFSAAAGLLWYGQFFFYSMGETCMGPYDFASWALHMAGTILFATLWGAVLHEWQGTSTNTKRIGAIGLAILLLATIIIGYGSYLEEPSQSRGVNRLGLFQRTARAVHARKQNQGHHHHPRYRTQWKIIVSR